MALTAEQQARLAARKAKPPVGPGVPSVPLPSEGLRPMPGAAPSVAPAEAKPVVATEPKPAAQPETQPIEEAKPAEPAKPAQPLPAPKAPEVSVDQIAKEATDRAVARMRALLPGIISAALSAPGVIDGLVARFADPIVDAVVAKLGNTFASAKSVTGLSSRCDDLEARADAILKVTPSAKEGDEPTRTGKIAELGRALDDVAADLNDQADAIDRNTGVLETAFGPDLKGASATRTVNAGLIGSELMTALVTEDQTASDAAVAELEARFDPALMLDAAGAVPRLLNETGYDVLSPECVRVTDRLPPLQERLKQAVAALTTRAEPTTTETGGS